MTATKPARPTHQAAMLTWLQSRPEGATVAETRTHFDRLPHAVSCGIARLLVLGLIGWLDVPNPSTQRRAKATVRRYWAREHCPPGATMAAAVKPLVRAMNGGPKLAKIPAAPNANTVRKPKRGEPVRPQGEARITERTKVTIWRPPVDPRRAVIEVEPFFAAGKRLQADTAIQRAYGAQP